MADFFTRLNAGKILVSDGAMGTMLFERGLRPGDCPEKLNLDQPDILRDIARAYAAAGADIIHTNTFGGSAVKLSEYGLVDRTENINREAVKTVREAVPDTVFVSGSCGPSGKLLEPYGDGRPADLQRGFERQIQGLIDGGADLICVETMTDIQEAVLAIQAVKAVKSDIPVMATMTFDKTPRGYFTIMGVSIADAITGLTAAGADVVGSNCGNGLENMIEIAAAFCGGTDLPVIIQSNAGMPETQDGRLIYKEPPDFFAKRIAALMKTGVSIIGGCCGTTPEHIRVIRRAVDSVS